MSDTLEKNKSDMLERLLQQGLKFQKLGQNEFSIVLTQGLNRQIRRMCEFLDYRVTKLQRVRIMNIELDLPVGKWREFTEDELKGLNLLLESSQKTN